MVTVSFAEIFAGDLPRIDDIVIFPDQANRPGLSGSMPAGTQVVGSHLVGFNTNYEYLDNSVKKQSFDRWVDHFKIENPILITRRGGGFAIEQGVVPECFRREFHLKFRPSFREEDLPKDNEEVLQEIANIKRAQAGLDRGAIGSGAYALSINLWWRTSELSKIVESLKQPVS